MQHFPFQQVVISSHEPDIVAWGVVFISVLLTIYGKERSEGGRASTLALCGGSDDDTEVADVAADLTAIKNLLIPDIVAWGVAAIGLGLTASAVLWIMRIVRSA